MYNNINGQISKYTTKVLQSYLKFPNDQPITALDWTALDGSFLYNLTKKNPKSYLFGVDPYAYNCSRMKADHGFYKTSQASYQSEANITNEAFSLIVLNPQVDSRIADELFNTIDPYLMPDFEKEIRDEIERNEEKKQSYLSEIRDQVDFGKLNEDNTENKEVKKATEEETEKERNKRINEFVKKELKKRIKSWRAAAKVQQNNMANMRYDGFLLQRSTRYLKPGGILIMITPKDLIDDTVCFKLVNQYEDIKIIRLEDEEYKESRKCIIIAKKREKASRSDHQIGKILARTKEKPYQTFGTVREITASEKDEELYKSQLLLQRVDKMYETLEIQVEPSYDVPASDKDEIENFRVGSVTPEEALSILQRSKLVQAYQEKYSQSFINQDPVTPAPLHKGHIMLLLTSGILNGYIGTGPDQHLVKGSAVKNIREFQETDDDGTSRVIEREYYNIGVKLLNHKGEFRKIM